jgi:hypothetical protein
MINVADATTDVNSTVCLGIGADDGENGTTTVQQPAGTQW